MTVAEVRAARLVAAAPELLELLRAYVGRCPRAICPRNEKCVCFRATVLVALLDSEEP